MMRKHSLIPQGSPYRRGYIDNIPLHQQIRAAGAARRPDSDR
jgi:hypothetical protein